MRVLITGGAGFIGSHTVDACLVAGHLPFVVDNLSTGSRENVPENVPLFCADIRDAAALSRVFDEVHPDAVCHLAAQPSVGRSMSDPSLDADINIVGLIRVLEQSARSGVSRFVFASSGGCLYGEVDSPADEQAPVRPICPYGLSKWAGEQYVALFARRYGWRAAVLRYSNVYGPRQRSESDGGAVAIFSQALLARQSIRIYGDGTAVRDFVHVDDVARGNLLALSNLDVGCVVFNLGTGIPTTINELARLLVQALRRQQTHLHVLPHLHLAVRSGDLRSNLVNIETVGQALDWRPQTTLEAGLENTIAWFARRLLP